MTTHLIVLTSLDELKVKKDKLVNKFDNDGNLKKYGDDSVETADDHVFFLKVITLSEYRTKLLQQIGRGYDHIDLGSVIAEISGLLNQIHNLQNPESPAIQELATDSVDKDDEGKTEEKKEYKTDEELLDENL